MWALTILLLLNARNVEVGNSHLATSPRNPVFLIEDHRTHFPARIALRCNLARWRHGAPRRPWPFPQKDLPPSAKHVDGHAIEQGRLCEREVMLGSGHLARTRQQVPF
jgi:hypothetical protein